MEPKDHWLPVMLRWASIGWLSVLPLYVTLLSQVPLGARNIGASLAVLLVPAIVVFSVAWILDRWVFPDKGGQRSAVPRQERDSASD